MPIRSITGFAHVRSNADSVIAGQPAFTLSLKSVNHRSLDLHMRMPSDTDGLEMKLRRLLKERMNRGHVDLTLSIERGGTAAMQLNRELVSGYISEFRAAAREFGIDEKPDLNAILKMPGALSAGSAVIDEAFEGAVLARAEQAIKSLNEMRAEEGRGMEQELRRRMEALAKVTGDVEKMRSAVSKAYFEKVQSRMNELIAGKADSERILQEAAMLAERSDIAEEVVRLASHLDQFQEIMKEPESPGRKREFLTQEMFRETNTIGSKASDVEISRHVVEIKGTLEKIREMVQNIE